MKTKIIADSTCDLPQAIIDTFDIEIIPLYVILDDKAYKDKLEMTPEEVIAWSDREGKTPKTSAASVEDIKHTMQPYVDEGREIVFVTISSGFSSTYGNANLAVEEFEGVKIRVVDSKNLSTGFGLVVHEAAEMAAEGKGADEIADHLDTIIPKVRASFFVDKLTFLYRGGRCSALAAFGANALKLKPQIKVENGLMGTGDKYRGSTMRVCKKYCEAVLEDIERIEPKRVYITYSPSDREIVDAALEVVRSKGYFGEVLESSAGCVITSHCGYNTLGVLYIEK